MTWSESFNASELSIVAEILLKIQRFEVKNDMVTKFKCKLIDHRCSNFAQSQDFFLFGLCFLKKNAKIKNNSQIRCLIQRCSATHSNSAWRSTIYNASCSFQIFQNYHHILKATFKQTMPDLQFWATVVDSLAFKLCNHIIFNLKSLNFEQNIFFWGGIFSAKIEHGSEFQSSAVFNTIKHCITIYYKRLTIFWI